MHDELQVRATTSKIRRGAAAVALTALAAVCAWGAQAAEQRPASDAVQAQCIQEAMLRGAIGERLQGYVDACVKSRGGSATPAVKPEVTDTPAC